MAGSITDTYKVRKPNGEITEVNVFDYNLAYCAKDNPYVQCSDTSWLRVRALTIVPKPKPSPHVLDTLAPLAR